MKTVILAGLATMLMVGAAASQVSPSPRDALIIPSHDLVVVRMGHFKGAGPGRASFRKALSLLMEAVPAKK